MLFGGGPPVKGGGTLGLLHGAPLGAHIREIMLRIVPQLIRSWRSVIGPSGKPMRRKESRCCGLDLNQHALSGTNDLGAKRVLSFDRVLAD
jgi:hypothetical protein